MNKKTYLFLFLSLIFFQSKSQSLFNLPNDGADCYVLADFQEIEKLKTIIEQPDNKSFIDNFDKEFGKSYDAKAQYDTLSKLGIDDWEMQLFENRTKQLEFLKNYTAASLSDEFKTLVSASINWNYWHLLLAYPILRSNKDTQSKRVVSLPRIMTDDLKGVKIDNATDLPLDAYRRFLPLYITYFNSAEKDFLKYADMVKSTTDKVNFAQKILKDNTLDYTTAKIVADYCDLLTASSARYLVSQVYDASLQLYLNEKCKEALTRKEEPKSEETNGKSNDKKKKTDSNLPQIVDLADKTFDFSKFKGKVIYVDFWASWCGPCRKEIPYSKEMHASLSEKQKKEIIFLYISIDEDLEAWKKAVEQMGMKDAGENGHSYEVAGRYQIRSIPRYMIINKNGEIVEENAPRPSNPETLSKLLKLIE